MEISLRGIEECARGRRDAMRRRIERRNRRSRGEAAHLCLAVLGVHWPVACRSIGIESIGSSLTGMERYVICIFLVVLSKSSNNASHSWWSRRQCQTSTVKNLYVLLVSQLPDTRFFEWFPRPRQTVVPVPGPSRVANSSLASPELRRLWFACAVTS